MLQWPLTKGIFSYLDQAKSVNEVMDNLMWIMPRLNPNCGKTEPPDRYKIDGFLAYANNDGWAPGTVKGYYRWDATTEAWKIASPIRAITSLWWYVSHVAIAEINPGASGATWTATSSDTLGGWKLDNSSELLQVVIDVHSDWDEESDIELKIIFEVNVDNTGGNDTDTVDLKAVAYYKGTGDIACKTQTVEEATVVGKSEQYKLFVCTMLLNYDEVDNIIETGDKMTIILNLETDTSEVDNIIVNHVHTRYKTRKINTEV